MKRGSLSGTPRDRSQSPAKAYQALVRQRVLPECNLHCNPAQTRLPQAVLLPYPLSNRIRPVSSPPVWVGLTPRSKKGS